MEDSTIDDRAGRSPLIEAFGITGLYGYRTISLDAGNAATILIAKNGSGKTTLLGVLNAFLSGQFIRLKGLEFESVYCKLRNNDDMLVLSKVDLESGLTVPKSGEFATLVSKTGLQSQQLFQFLLEEYPLIQRSREASFDNQVFSMLIREYSYNSRRVEKIIEDLQHQIYGQNQNVFNIFQSIKTALSGFEVLYLPTYRRVELALRREQNDARNKKKAPRFDVEPNGLFTGDIQFGLTDISDRLREINRKIVFDSNHQYRSISAAIINDLIDGTYETAELSSSIPKKEDLELLFSRVAQGRREVGAHFAVNIPNLEKIYSNKGVPKSSEKFLNYFLTQIDKVINSTRNVETRVQEFIDRCNAYLSMEEISTQFDEKDMIASVDGKRLILNKENLHVKVVTIPDERPVSLDALSSGEKQMISLFAKLYLYEAPKIVLIDEPELSLSIEWQKKILVDIVKSPMCEQLIAITHSPFVFDNELDSFAGSLHVSVNPVVVLFDEDEGKAFDVDGFDE